MSVQISVKNVMKKFGDNVVIPDLSLEIKEGEFFTLLGPSGCGKTTLLRMIAGFNSIEAGSICFDDTRINEMPVHQREVGMVFQNYAIFPHMNTFDNVAYGLRNQKLDEKIIEEKVKEILDVVQIAQLIDRMPQNMSGGQQQRVALARAIVTNTKVLLMDEPLSNLDAKLRIEMRTAIKDMHDRLGITTIYVTHDQEEALAMSDHRIAVMKDGLLQQLASPEEIYHQPSNLYVGTFIGRSNVIEGNLMVDRDVRLRFFNQSDVHLELSKPITQSQEVKILLRPTELKISETEGVSARIIQKNFFGEVTQYIVQCVSGEVLEIDHHNLESSSYEIGEEIFVQFESKRLKLFDMESEASLGYGEILENKERD